jgi:peptidoglycan/LPS O-acetylase OafA/YrhL
LQTAFRFTFEHCDDLGREAFVAVVRQRRMKMSIGTIILIILVIALLGGFSGIGGGPFYGMGYYGGGGLGIVVLVLLVLVLLGKL